MSNNDYPPMICQVCQRALDMVVTDEGVPFVHALADPDRHHPVPVSAQAGWRGKCDFCTAENPTHVLPARDFTVPGTSQHMSVGNWAACQACADLLLGDHWEWLIARVIARFHAVYGYPMPTSGQNHLTQLYQALSRAVGGPLRPIIEPPSTPPTSGEGEAGHG